MNQNALYTCVLQELQDELHGTDLKLDPYNQPSVELIKTETKKILI
mgnify:CR=1 FL=1